MIGMKFRKKREKKRGGIDEKREGEILFILN